MNDYIKLHEISIYGLDESTLKKRVENKILKLKQISNNSSVDIQKRVIDINTYPMKNWEYNHIVGYIKVISNRQDIDFKIYLPITPSGTNPAYYWHSHTKNFVVDACYNGLHIYIEDMKSNEEICQVLDKMLTDIIKNYLPKKYFADRRLFDTLNPVINYISLLQKGSL